MSVKAYRVIEVKMETASFNLWHDHKLMQLLDGEGDFSSNLSDGVGLTQVPVKLLKRAVRMSTKLDINKETVKQLQEDIAAAKANGEDHVTYYCF